ncbi:RidA family protein [Elioraea sp.]|uniref:RidA family protein n=1 Tax=Elioraea sp. TaxID=2185103 RepID=UPI003F70866B
MAVLQFVNPPGVHDPAGRYSHVAVATGATRWVLLAGQVGTRPDGTVPEEIGAQCEQAMANVLAALRSQGLGPESIAKMTVFLTDASYIPASREARQKALGSITPPASTLLIVAGLASPALKVEIEAIACA